MLTFVILCFAAESLLFSMSTSSIVEPILEAKDMDLDNRKAERRRTPKQYQPRTNDINPACDAGDIASSSVREAVCLATSAITPEPNTDVSEISSKKDSLSLPRLPRLFDFLILDDCADVAFAAFRLRDLLDDCFIVVGQQGDFRRMHLSQG